MGRGKVELKRIENKVSRQVTFAKRRKGLLKKAHELAVLCDVDVAVVLFSERGKLFDYSSPTASLIDLIRRYEATTNTQLLQGTCCTDHHHQQQQMIDEISRLRHAYEQLEAGFRAYTGEDLSSLASLDELDDLERQLETALSRVRARKDELFVNLTDELQLKINENGARHGAAAAAGMEPEGIVEPLPPSPSFAYLLNVEEKAAASKMLQLWPQTTEDDVVAVGGGGDGSSSRRGLQLW